MKSLISCLQRRANRRERGEKVDRVMEVVDRKRDIDSNELRQALAELSGSMTGRMSKSPGVPVVRQALVEVGGSMTGASPVTTIHEVVWQATSWRSDRACPIEANSFISRRRWCHDRACPQYCSNKRNLLAGNARTPTRGSPTIHNVRRTHQSIVGEPLVGVRCEPIQSILLI